MRLVARCSLALVAVLSVSLAPLSAGDLERLRYNNPGLTVDLGVGLWAWPMPMDWDNDGDLDLVIVSGGKPYEGTWFFENPGGSKTPVFKPGVRVAGRDKNAQLSPDGMVMSPGANVNNREGPSRIGVRNEKNRPHRVHNPATHRTPDGRGRPERGDCAPGRPCDSRLRFRLRLRRSGANAGSGAGRG